MKKIPYGISSYEKIQTENYYYIDKTKYIEIIENYGSTYHFFLRPRRFGKSLFISMLHHYYDIKQKENFESLFGDTYIGKNPTPTRNTFPVMRFNFSMVKTFGDISEIRTSFLKYIQSEVEYFIDKYNDIFSFSVNDITRLRSSNFEDMDILRDLFIKLRQKNIHSFVIIDEYDNFANNILTEHGEETYTKVTHAGGFLRNFFTNLKGLTDNREIDRLFITGVSPLVMADVTSGFNIGDNISQDPQLSAMIGITNEEAKQILDYYNSFGIFKQSLDSILDDFNQWYNGYSFNKKLEKIYNTISVLYYIHQYIKNEDRPIILTDENMRTDYGKFRFLLTRDNKLNGNFSVLKEVAQTGETTGDFIRSFALNELIDKEKFLSLLFYLGFTSFKEITPFGKYTYTIPNKMINTILWEFIQKSLNEVYQLNIDRHFLGNAFSEMANKNNWKPVLQYIVDKFYEAVSIRDFVFHEEGMKTFLLAWLNMTNLFSVYSEKELNQGFADIYLEPEPRYSDYVKYGYIIELKYIKSEFLKSKKKSEPEVKRAIETATAQLNQYSPYNNCTTTKIIIVASAKKLLYIDLL
jgi:hypothetical protein